MVTGVQTCALPIFTHAKDIVDDMKKRVIHLSNGLIVRDEEGGVYDEKA